MQRRTFRKELSFLSSATRDLLFPPRCVGCDELLPPFIRHTTVFCPLCRVAWETAVTEAADHAAMSKSWAECWTAYTARMHYPVKPAEHPFDTAAIREQWIAGGVCMCISAIIIFFILRTRSRVMSLQGDTVSAAGQTFQVADISRLDLRQWGKGFKGVAYATVNGRKIRLDGMTYGGFDPAAGQPAEEFMKALLSRYEGEVLEYEQTEDTAR